MTVVRRLDLPTSVEAGISLVLVGGLATLAGAMSLRWWVLVLGLVIAAQLSSLRMHAVVAAVALVPFLALLRRLTGGLNAYVENDPLVLLPFVLSFPPLLLLLLKVRLRLVPLPLLVTAALLLVSGALGVARSPAAGAYGLLTQGVPLGVGLVVAAGSWPGLVGALRAVLMVSSPVAAVYGIVQRLHPSSWDLAWLLDRQEVLVSIGTPEKGGFRVFGTMESPGPYALFLTLGLAAYIAALFTPRWRTPGRLLMAVPFVAIMFVAVALTSVRAALFALPIALLVWTWWTRLVPRWTALVVFAFAGLLVVTVPVLIGIRGSGTDVSAARYQVGSIGQDPSFQERAAILPEFASLLTQPLGVGPGLVGTANTLAGGDIKVVDNGYLARGQELGLLGLVGFVAAASTALVHGRRGLRKGYDELVAWPLLVILLVSLFELTGAAVSGPLGFFFWTACGALLTAERLRTAAPGAGVTVATA